jgi:hypothetical protein
VDCRQSCKLSVSLHVSISLFSVKVLLGAVRNYSEEFEVGKFPPDGLIGLAFRSLSQFTSQRDPLFTTLVAQESIAPAFGVKLAENGSELFLGGVNNALFEPPFKNVSLIEKVSGTVIN